MARPPKRPDLKLIQGTARSRKRGRPKAQRPSRCPAAPAHMSPAAKHEWRKLAPKAHQLGTLTDADLRAFELLCDTLVVVNDCRETLAREGFTAATGDGGMKTHPLVSVMNSANTFSVRLLSGFGLTPRGRLSAIAAPDDSLPPDPHGFFAS